MTLIETFKDNLLEDLGEIDFKLISNSNSNLLEDKNMISYFVLKQGNYESEKDQESFSERDKIDIIASNNLEHFKNIRNFRCTYDAKNSKEIFEAFLADHDLIDLYNDMIKNNRIKYNPNKTRYLGETLYLKSLNKGYIRFYHKDDLSTYSTLIHELGHVYQMLNKSNYNNSAFEETYPLFLQLLYSDHLKKYKLYKQSFNLKNGYIKKTVIYSYYLYDKIGGNDIINSFDYDFMIFVSLLLAFKFKSLNEKERKEKIGIFLNKVNTCSDYDLLDFLGMSINDLKSLKTIIPFNKELLEEKKKIKKKIFI